MVNPVWLVPMKVRGSRWLKSATLDYFRPTRRALGTSDVSWCGWINVTALPPSGARFLWASHTSSGSRIGWGLSLLNTGVLRLSWGTAGSDPADLKTSDSGAVITANVWHFIAVVLDRSDRGKVWVNDMTTANAVIDADISGEVAADWASGVDPWYLGGVASATVDVKIARFGMTVGAGNLLTETNRTVLYAAGRGLRYSQLTGDELTLFTSQDYFDCRERTGTLTNQATVGNPATPYAGATTPAHIGYWGPPRR